MQHPYRRIVLLRVLWRAVAAALATASVLAVAALLGVCPAQATALRLAKCDVQPGVVGGGTRAVDDSWDHDLQVIANIKAYPPAEPVVCLLGGSAARECIIGDMSWAAQVQALGATALTYDLGSTGRTFALDAALMENLPSGQLDMIVFIGISVSEFSIVERSDTLPPPYALPTPTFPAPPWQQHMYGPSNNLPVAQKRALVSQWIANNSSFFQADFSANRRMLKRLITVCKSRGLHPVLVETPRNMAIIGHRMDAPLSRVRRTCRALSAKYSIPFLSGFVGATHLANGDFHDLWHIVRPGRVKWQRLLSKKTAELLQRYDLS